MSRKRALKKQQKRQEGARSRLDDLLARGADDEALALAAREWKDPSVSPAAEAWAAAADRSLVRALAGADLARLERLLSLLKGASRPGPLAALAAAVLDLGAGRLEAARGKLDALSTGAAAGELSPELLAALAALARGEPAAGGDVAPVHALWDALCELEAAGGELPAGRLDALGERIEEAAAGPVAGDAEALSLLELCASRLDLVTELGELVGELSAAPRPARVLLDRLGQSAGRLAAALEDPGPPLAEPLRHAVRRRWRAALERVAAAEGSGGLEALAAAHPRLLAGELRGPGGAPPDLRPLAEGARARRLVAEGRYEELRRLLRKSSRAEGDPGALAALWGLELWAVERQSAVDDEDGEAFFGPSGPPGAVPGEVLHGAVVRLAEMAGEIGRRFAPEQRLEVAQELRRELLRLCEATYFCDHTAAAAAALLEHADGDPGLLLAAVAGAVVGRDRAALRLLEERLARQRPLRRGDREVALLVMAQVAMEDALDEAMILRRLRPLFDDELWPEVRDRMARETVGLVAGGLEMATEALESDEDPEEAAHWAVERLRLALDALEPYLKPAPGFAAAALALECWAADDESPELLIDAYLAAQPGWQAALLPMKALKDVALELPRNGVLLALGRLANAVIDRLDDGWRLWVPDLPVLLLTADARHQRKLVSRLKRLAKARDLSPPDRELIEGCLQMLKQAKALREALERRGPWPGPDAPGGEPGEGPRRKRRPRLAEDRQLSLGFSD